MARVTRKQLDDYCEFLRKITGRNYAIHGAYGQPRLEENDGSIDVSPRLPTGELLEWMYAFYKGISVGMEVAQKKHEAILQGMEVIRKQEKMHQTWANYETFLIATEIDNDKVKFDEAREAAKIFWERAEHFAEEQPHLSREEHAKFMMADWLKGQFDTDEIEGVYASLANAALEEVDWHELADHYLGMVKTELEKS